jgi:hypothetical protein
VQQMCGFISLLMINLAKRQNMVPHIDKDTKPDNVILYFAAAVTLLLKINWYGQQYLYIQTVGFLLHDMAEHEIFPFC